MQKFLWTALFLLAMTACSGSNGSPGETVTPDIGQTRTPTAVPTITLLPPLTPPAGIILPTATPVTYAVQGGDTMSAIAEEFHISLDALLAANPGVDPSSMPIGTVLVIPFGTVVVGEPSPTPAALALRQASCWPELTGGLWCFTLVQNEYAATLENIAVQFTLLDDSGNAVASQVAYGLLNILPAGESMPLGVHFSPPLASPVTPRVQVLTSILLLPSDTRYLPVALQNILVQMDTSGRTAQVSGQVMPTMLDGQVNTLWILGTAYDVAGNVVGVRRWESTSMLPGGVSMPFSFNVYSVGPAIERVELLVEARP